MRQEKDEPKELNVFVEFYRSDFRVSAKIDICTFTFALPKDINVSTADEAKGFLAQLCVLYFLNEREILCDKLDKKDGTCLVLFMSSLTT